MNFPGKEKQAAKEETIENLVNLLETNSGKLDADIKLRYPLLVSRIYQDENYITLWTKKKSWQPITDSLFRLIAQAPSFGLFRDAYHYESISRIKSKLDADSLKRLEPVLWSKADLLLTDACIRFLYDIRYGRLRRDSSLFKNDTSGISLQVLSLVKAFSRHASPSIYIRGLEPVQPGYHALKAALPSFLDSMDNKVYTYVYYPFIKNNSNDSLRFMRSFQTRLREGGWLRAGKSLADSATLDSAIRNYQRSKKIKSDGLVSTALVRNLNTTDFERFRRVAITLDRYKLLPRSMPRKYVWVNLPAFNMQVHDDDSVALESRVICGRPYTPTPTLTSAISDMVIYPTWTVPNSIISRQYLPRLKNNPNYLSRLRLKLINSKGEIVSPSSVNWSKYNNAIPFRVVQASGDNNSLGVIKFNFNNPYAVYLHDTNERYLFKNSSRALSHGCVRVQEWEKLALWIARNDSLLLKAGDTLRYTTDSIRMWLAAKRNRNIPVLNHVPLYINYFSCEGKNGQLLFHDDIYGDDKAMREKYFQ